MIPIALPVPPFRARVLRRAVGLWLLLRLGWVIVGMLIGLGPVDQLIFLTALAAGFVVVLTTGLTLFDAQRRGEVLFLANLGVARRDLAVLALAPVIALELLVRMAGSL